MQKQILSTEEIMEKARYWSNSTNVENNARFIEDFARALEEEILSRLEFTWHSIKDYEKDIGFEINSSFEIGWKMARTTNAFLNIKKDVV